MKALGIRFPVEKIRKRQKLYLVTSVALCVTGNVLAVVLGLNQFRIFFALPFAESVSVIIVALSMMFMMTLIWIFPVTYIVMLCIMMTASFKSFNKCLEENLTQNLVSKTCQFQRLRQLHLNLSKMVLYLDKDFGIYLAFLFVFIIGFVCVVLYAGLKMNLDNLALVAIIFVASSALSILGIVSVYAAFVHEAVSQKKYIA